jgi:predicted Zn-dependent peptidase
MAERALLRTLLAPDSAYYPGDLSGKSASVANLKVADLAEFRAQFLNPEATTLVLVGDINIDVAAKIIEQSFAGWLHNGVTLKPFPNVTANSRHALKASIPIHDKAKTFVALGGLLRGADGVNYSSLMLADCAMTNHPIFSRLAQTIGSDPHLSENFSADQIESKFTPIGDSVVWSINLPVPPNVVSAAANMVQAEMRKFARTGVTNEEFSEVKRYLLCSLPLKQLSNDTDAAKSILDGSLHGNGKLFYSELAGKLRSSTLDNLNKFIHSDFKPDQATLVVAGTKETMRSIHGTKSNGSTDGRPGVDANATEVKKNE